MERDHIVLDNDLLTYFESELKGISAALKDCARDTTGLMYEQGPDGSLRLRDFVVHADTNNPPADCDTAIWAVRGRIQSLQDVLERALSACRSANAE